MRIKTVLAFSLLGALTIVYAASVPKRVKLASEQTLRIDLGFEPKDVHPHYASTLYESWVANDLFEALISEDAKGNQVPGAAVQWKTNEDYTVWTFHLRPEARWSNGDPVTAEDFVYSARTLLISDSAKANEVEAHWKLKNAGAVKKGVLPRKALGIRALDRHTLQITLRAPDSYFPERFGSEIYPLHKDSLSSWSTGSDTATPQFQVTNGAYCNLIYVANLKYQAERNPYYWDNAHTVIDRVEYYFTKNLWDREEAFLNQTMDLSDLVGSSAGLEDKFTAKFGQRFKHRLNACELEVIVNTDQGPIHSARVLEALDMVIDRENVLDYLKIKKNLPVYSKLNSDMDKKALIEPEWASWPYGKRVDEARKRIEGSNLPPITLICSPAVAKTKLPVLLSKMWETTLDIQVCIIKMDFQTILQKDGAKLFHKAGIKIFNMPPFRGKKTEITCCYSFFSNVHRPINQTLINITPNSSLTALLKGTHDPTLTAEKRKHPLPESEDSSSEKSSVLSLYCVANDYLVQPYVGGIDSDKVMGRFKAKDLYLVAKTE